MSLPLSQTGNSVENIMLCSYVGIDAIAGSSNPVFCSDFVIKCIKMYKNPTYSKKSLCIKCDEYLVRNNTKLTFLISTRQRLCSMLQQPNSGPSRLIVEVSVIRHKSPVGLLWMDDQLVAEAATYTRYNKHKRRTSIPSAGFEPAISAMKRLQTYTFDCTATGIGLVFT